MGRPLVTVFMAVYNAEEYLEQSLESILNQTYENLEILIVDDGSTDNSWDIISQYNDNRIIRIKNEKNRGIPYCRNLGLMKATGEYYAVMDSDDISTEDRIEIQVSYLEKNSDIDVVASNYLKFGGKLKKRVINPYTISEELKISLIFSNTIANPSSMVRLSTLRKYDITYNKDYFVAQDYDFWLQISKVGKLIVLPDILLNYREGHSNISKVSRQKKANERNEIIYLIHRDAISYYGLNLTDEEIDIFHRFFTNNPIIEHDKYFINSLPALFEKIIEIIKVNKSLDMQLFMKVLYKNTIFSISNLKVGLRVKINLFNKLSKLLDIKSTRDTMYIILKHFYNKV